MSLVRGAPKPLWLGVAPLQKHAERGASMAIFGFLFGTEFGEGLPDLRKIKQRIVAKSIRTVRRIENESFGGSAKCC